MEGGRSSSSFYKSRLCKVTPPSLQLQLQLLLLLLGFFIWFLLLVSVVDSTRTIPPPPPASEVAMGGGRSFRLVLGVNSSTDHVQLRPSSHHHHHYHHHKDHKRMERLKFVSKRRVPNGPDPIHNRRAGNSNQPPGRSQGVVDAEIKGGRL